MLGFKGLTISGYTEIKGIGFQQCDNGDVYIDNNGIIPESLEISFDGGVFLKVHKNYELFCFESFKVEGSKSTPYRTTKIKQPKLDNRTFNILIEK